MNALLRWWALFLVMVTAASVCGTLGLFHTLWVDDLSKLSFFTLSLFSIATGWIGVLTYRFNKNLRKVPPRAGDEVVKYLPSLWFISEALMGMGMMGTLLGFIMMFTSNVAHIDFSNVETAKQILAQLTKGTTTAVVTTFVGLLCSLLTKAQLVSLELDFPKDE